jgi:hypothetical protein
MPFAPEDTRVWESSEVMAEFEKIAAETRLLDGGPPEAFQPIPEKEAAEASPSWEDDEPAEAPELPDLGRAMALKEFASRQSALLPALKKIARDLADRKNIKGAYRVERAVAELEAVMAVPAEGGE